MAKGSAGVVTQGPTGTIRRGTGVPYHVQLRHLVLAAIERGEFPPGSLLPTERDLAARYGISLSPVRQALLDLVREGVLRRVPGSGTFVRGDRPAAPRVPVVASFTQSMHALGFEVETEVLREEVVTPLAAIRETFGDRPVRCLERLARVDGEPYAIFTSFLAEDRFPGLTLRRAGHASLYEALVEEYATAPERAEMAVEVVPCTTAQAALLGLPPGAPLLHVEGCSFVGTEPIEVFRATYRHDRVRLQLDAVRSAEGPLRVERR